MLLKTVCFFALVLTALALVPAAAHIFVLPNKIGLSEDQYFIVQTLYRGWAWFGVVILAALFLNLLLICLLRGQRLARTFALTAFLGLAAGLAVFFIWTYPANLATDNWTTLPEDWATLRTQWEYSHVANAVLSFIGFCSLALAAINARHERS